MIDTLSVQRFLFHNVANIGFQKSYTLNFFVRRDLELTNFWICLNKLGYWHFLLQIIKKFVLLLLAKYCFWDFMTIWYVFNHSVEKKNIYRLSPMTIWETMSIIRIVTWNAGSFDLSRLWHSPPELSHLNSNLIKLA